MKMKVQLDMFNSKNLRKPKDICIGYKRFSIISTEKVIPELIRTKQTK